MQFFAKINGKLPLSKCIIILFRSFLTKTTKFCMHWLGCSLKLFCPEESKYTAVIIYIAENNSYSLHICLITVYKLAELQ